MKLKIYIDRRRGESPYPVKLRINRDGEVFFVGTPLTCSTDIVGREFLKKDKERGTEDRNATAKTGRLAQILKDAEEVILSATPDMSTKELREAIEDAISDTKPTRRRGRLFSDCVDDVIATKSNDGTIGLYKSTRNKVEAYSPNILIGDINEQWLGEFQSHEYKRGISVNGLSVHLRNIRHVMFVAKKNGHITDVPFGRDAFTIKKKKAQVNDLSAKELAVLRDYPCEPFQEKYRDMFMLMFYMIGINASDLFMMKSVKKGKVSYYRNKTGRLYEFTLQPEARRIIEKYKGEEYMLNIMEQYSGDERKRVAQAIKHMNAALKTIGLTYEKGKKAVGKPLFPDISTYSARYSWATIAANKAKIPMIAISAALGHGGTGLTENYINSDKDLIDDANRKVIDYVNAIKPHTGS